MLLAFLEGEFAVSRLAFLTDTWGDNTLGSILWMVNNKENVLQINER